MDKERKKKKTVREEKLWCMKMTMVHVIIGVFETFAKILTKKKGWKNRKFNKHLKLLRQQYNWYLKESQGKYQYTEEAYGENHLILVWKLIFKTIIINCDTSIIELW